MTETPIYTEVERGMNAAHEYGRLLGIAEENLRVLQIIVNAPQNATTQALLLKIGDLTWQQDSAGPLTKRKLHNAKNVSAKNG